jgi:hypothetical protein
VDTKIPKHDKRAEAYEYALDTDEVLCTYHPPGSEEAHAIFEAAKYA